MAKKKLSGVVTAAPEMDDKYQREDDMRTAMNYGDLMSNPGRKKNVIKSLRQAHKVCTGRAMGGRGRR